MLSPSQFGELKLKKWKIWRTYSFYQEPPEEQIISHLNNSTSQTF